MATIPEPVLTVLSAAEMSGRALRLTGQLDRKLYTQTNAVLEAAGGKWDRKAKAHLFEVEAAEAIEPILLTGEYSKPQDFGFFETPADVAERVIALADIRPGMSVLEPSAGRGALARPARSAGGDVACVELQERNAAHLVADKFASVIVGDFLGITGLARCDRIVMNPPFAGQADIRHVRRAAEYLRPGGRLVSIMSAGIDFRTNALTIDFRKWLADHEGSITRLPAGSFKPSGTDVNTVIVQVQVRA